LPVVASVGSPRRVISTTLLGGRPDVEITLVNRDNFFLLSPLLFEAWWVRRTYYLFQMPRWDTRLRIALDWTVSLFYRPDLTKIDLAVSCQQHAESRER
jgi:hypothetical protein